MRGDLSNRVASAVGVRFEHIVYDYGKINQPGKAFLEHLLNIDCNIFLVTLLDDRKVKAICYKYAIPYTGVLQCDSTLEIPEICRAHHMVIYYDTDDRILQAVSERGNPRTETSKWEQPLDGPITRPNHEADRPGSSKRGEQIWD